MLLKALSLVLLPRQERNLSFFILDLHLLRHITTLVFETSVSQRRLFLRLRMDRKVENTTLGGDDGNKKEVEALSNTPLAQFLQTVFCLY